MNIVIIKDLYKKETGKNVDNLSYNDLLHNKDFLEWYTDLFFDIFSHTEIVSLKDLIKEI